MSNIARDGSTYHNIKKRDYYTWVRKHILSATCTLVHRRRSTWRPFMTVVIGAAQCDVRTWQCILLPFVNDCAHTVFVSSTFTLSVTETDSQPNVVGHYGQVYRSQKVCVSKPMFIELFFSLFWWVLPPLEFRHLFLTSWGRPGPLMGCSTSDDDDDDVRQMSGNIGHIHHQVSFGNQNHLKKPYSSGNGWQWSMTLGR